MVHTDMARIMVLVRNQCPDLVLAHMAHMARMALAHIMAHTVLVR